MRYVEKSILLQTLDHLWREHLIMLEHLRQVIGLRGFGQRDPLNEYKSEAFQLFEALIAAPARGGDGAADAGRDHAGAAAGAAARKPALHGGPPHQSGDRRGRDGDVGRGRHDGAQRRRRDQPPRSRRNPNDPTTWGKVGRNEVCPCGSGKKFKHCHGRFV